MVEASFNTKELLECKLQIIMASASKEWTLYHDEGYNPTVNSFKPLLSLATSKKFYYNCSICNQTFPLLFRGNELQVWVYTIGNSKIHYLCECNCSDEEKRNISHLDKVMTKPISFQQEYVDVTTDKNIFFSDFLPSSYQKEK